MAPKVFKNRHESLKMLEFIYFVQQYKWFRFFLNAIKLDYITLSVCLLRFSAVTVRQHSSVVHKFCYLFLIVVCELL